MIMHSFQSASSKRNDRMPQGNWVCLLNLEPECTFSSDGVVFVGNKESDICCKLTVGK